MVNCNTQKMILLLPFRHYEMKSTNYTSQTKKWWLATRLHQTNGHALPAYIPYATTRALPRLRLR
jgi:hypothetical protein